MQNRANFFKSRNLDKDITSLSDAISDLLQSNGVKESPDTKNFNAGLYAKPTSAYQKLMRQNQNTENATVANSHRFANHKQETIEKFKYILDCGNANKNISDEIKSKYNLKNAQ